MNKSNLNVLANALLDVLTLEGMPEGYLSIAAEKAGCHPSDSIAMLIDLGLLKRLPGFIIVPGPKWEAVLEARKQA